MSYTYLIFHRDPGSLAILGDTISLFGDQVHFHSTLQAASRLINEVTPDVILVDASLLGEGCLSHIEKLRRLLPACSVILTIPGDGKLNPFPDADFPNKGLIQEPINHFKLIQAMAGGRFEEIKPRNNQKADQRTPQVRFPIRAKITLPYILLAIILAIAAAYIVTRIVVDSVEERFANQLVESGLLTSEWMVQEESRLLETLRLVTFSQGTAEGIIQEDIERLRSIIYPIAVNSMEESVMILDHTGDHLLTLQHKRGGNLEDYEFRSGDNRFQNLDFISKVAMGIVDSRGNKFAGVIENEHEKYFYIAGPVHDPHGNIIGIVLVGKSLSSLVDQLRTATMAQITIYEFGKYPLESTFLTPVDLTDEMVSSLNSDQNLRSPIRDIAIMNISYREILGPWEVRGGEILGFIGSSLPKNFFVSLSQLTRIQVGSIVAIAFILVIFFGVILANQITSPLLRVVHATSNIARGKLHVRISPQGQDEITTLTHSFNIMVDALERSNAEILEAYDRSLEGWSQALELRDNETEGHSRRVAELSIQLAKIIGMNEEDLPHLWRGALLHDIGKMAIPDSVLQKPGPLTRSEWEIMRQHPIYAVKMLREIKFLRPAMEIPYCHHERWDGSGYPNGLKGNQIPLPARIFAIVDVWDALITSRPYRPAWDERDIVDHIQAGSGVMFDPLIVNAFLKMLQIEGRAPTQRPIVEKNEISSKPQ